MKVYLLFLLFLKVNAAGVKVRLLFKLSFEIGVKVFIAFEALVKRELK